MEHGLQHKKRNFMKTGRIWIFGDNIDTDQIIPSQYLLLPAVEQMKTHTFEGLVPDFFSRFRVGDVIISGKNFGCGSSREQAPLVLKALGTGAIIGKSFARIFFRNAINIGLPLIQCESLCEEANDGNDLAYAIKEGKLVYKHKAYCFSPFPDHILKIIDSGGLIKYINQIYVMGRP